MTNLLDVSNVSVSFRGTKALIDVSFDCQAGQITGLIGPNGAGKTTMFNVISGLLKPTSGKILLDGVDLSKANPAKRARQGISRTFQRLELFVSLTVRENLVVAGEIRNSLGRGEKFDVAAEADQVMALLDLTDVADVDVAALPTGRARVVEVARALMTRPKLVLLDEPSGPWPSAASSRSMACGAPCRSGSNRNWPRPSCAGPPMRATINSGGCGWRPSNWPTS